METRKRKQLEKKEGRQKSFTVRLYRQQVQSRQFWAWFSAEWLCFSVWKLRCRHMWTVFWSEQCFENDFLPHCTRNLAERSHHDVVIWHFVWPDYDSLFDLMMVACLIWWEWLVWPDYDSMFDLMTVACLPGLMVVACLIWWGWLVWPDEGGSFDLMRVAHLIWWG